MSFNESSRIRVTCLLFLAYSGELWARQTNQTIMKQNWNVIDEVSYACFSLVLDLIYIVFLCIVKEMLVQL